MNRRELGVTTLATGALSAAALLATLSPGAAAQSPGTPQAQAEDEAAIRRLIVEMTEGFNRHDARAATRMYTADADLVTVRGERFRGTEEFEKGLASIFATRARSPSPHARGLGALPAPGHRSGARGQRAQRPHRARRPAAATAPRAEPARAGQGRRRVARGRVPQHPRATVRRPGPGAEVSVMDPHWIAAAFSAVNSIR